MIPTGTAAIHTPRTQRPTLTQRQCRHCGKCYRDATHLDCAACRRRQAQARQAGWVTSRPRRFSSTPCAHCQVRAGVRTGGLCGVCVGDPILRNIYMRVNYRGRDDGDFCGGYSLPEASTVALPGTPEKAEVLAQRVLERVALHHPGDARVKE